MLRNISNFGFIFSMMESFPSCNTASGQRTLAMMTDDFVKSSELAIVAGRTPVRYSYLSKLFGGSCADEITDGLLNETLQNNAFRDLIVVLFDCNSEVRSFVRFINQNASAFCTMQFKLESFQTSFRTQVSELFRDTFLDLGSYKYCHCEKLSLEIPDVFYYLSALNAVGVWISVECAAQTSALILARSRAFAGQRLVLKCNYSGMNTSHCVPSVDDVKNWSAFDREVLLDSVIDLTMAYYDIWIIEQGIYLDDRR